MSPLATSPADSGAKLAKEYDFRTLKNLDEFTTRYMWEREKIINGEHQFYVDPTKVATENSPFRLTSAGLSIIAKPTPPELAGMAVGLDDAGLAIGVKNLTLEQFEMHSKPQPFISGAMTSRDKGWSQLFGYWEMFAKLPSAGGAWPAYWLYPTFARWPDGVDVLNEIDITEAMKDVLKGTYSGTLHTRESGGIVSSENNEIHTDRNLVNEYHRYGVSWEPDWIIWYFDGVEVIRRKTPSDMLNEPRHFLLNLAVGSDKWDAVGTPVPADYPASFDIEWVRIYESSYVAPAKKETDTSAPIENSIKALELTTEYLRQIAKLV